MPFLSEEEVDELNNKIGSLEESHSSLTELNNEYKEQITQKNNQKRGLTSACIVLFIGFIISVLFGFVFSDKKASAAKTPEPQIVRDTVFIEKEIVKEVPSNQTTASGDYYGIQLAVYRKFDADFTSDIQKIHKNGLIYYVLGRFATRQEAENLRLVLLDLKVQGPVVVKIENGDLVD